MEYLRLALIFAWHGALRENFLICVFQGVFASISGIFALAGGIGHWAIILLGLDTFLIFLKPSVVRQLVRQLVHTMFISNDHTSFHLW